eukprot:3166017-Rhodomonas_salina.2
MSGGRSAGRSSGAAPCEAYVIRGIRRARLGGMRDARVSNFFFFAAADRPAQGGEKRAREEAPRSRSSAGGGGEGGGGGGLGMSLGGGGSSALGVTCHCSKPAHTLES